MELQVLSNILPIAQIPALPACIRYTGNLMPIEDVFGVDKSLLEVEVVEDKRTWREGMRPTKPVLSPEREKWTALQVMSAYATKRGWQTARTGWPDSMRAGNASKLVFSLASDGRAELAHSDAKHCRGSGALGILASWF